MAVKSAMSEKKIVSSLSLPPMRASCRVSMSWRTRSSGTYFWNDCSPTFMSAMALTSLSSSTSDVRIRTSSFSSKFLIFSVSTTSCWTGVRMPR